ncbi:MAG: polysaccharide deacetylase family protein [Capsulimonadaceae bacterium]|nr:polysaccharide deacetylase family protein [Capsulimonadaceae bacterium]
MNRLKTASIATTCLGFAVLLILGCGHHRISGSAHAEPLKPLPLDLSKGNPNELGVVPILEYHELTVAKGTHGGYKFPLAKFRADMERLYKLGYRPISLHDFVTGHIDVPAGLSPVVITFDDALRGQVDFDQQGNISPNCAAGVLVDMHRRHPEWAQRAIFFVLPMKGSEVFFYQKEYSQQKLKWLVDNGFEIGNHTLHHLPGMRHWGDARVVSEIAGATALIGKYLPGYPVDTIALPFGVFPRNTKLVISGAANGVAYKHICALKAGAGPALPPSSKKFQAYAIPRMIPGNGQFEIGWWLTYLERHKAEKYVSDGDANTVTVAATQAKYASIERIKKNKLFFRTYQPLLVKAAPPKAG